MARHHSIRHQLGILVLAVALPLATLEIYSFVTSRRQWTRQARESALSYAEATALTVGQFLGETRQVLQRLAQRPAVRSMDGGICQEWVADAHAILPQYVNVLVADSTGTVVCTALVELPGVLPSVAHRRWFQDVLATHDFTIGEPVRGTYLDTWLAALAYPVFDSDGRLIGALGLPVDLLRFETFIAELTLPPGGIVTLAEDDGTVVARSEDGPRWVGQQLPTADDYQATAERGISESVGVEGIDRVWGFVQVPNSIWRVFAGLPVDYVRLEPRRAAYSSAVIGLALLGLVSVLSATTYRRTSTALQALVDDTRAAAVGDLSQVSTDGPAEIVAVAEQVNRTLAARKNAEHELRLANERLSSIMDNALFGLFGIDGNDQFLAPNATFVAMLGYDSAAELTQVNVRELFPVPGEFEIIRRQLLDSGRTGRDVMLSRKDGSQVAVRISAKLARDPQGNEFVEVVVEDITRRTELEFQVRQAQKMEAVGRLAGGIAHDFNNLLTVVHGQASFLLDDIDENDSRRRSAEQIVEAADRAAAVTRQLLAFSRKQMLNPQVLDLNALLSKLEKMVRGVLGERVALESVPYDQLWAVHADPGLLDQIVLNLVLNAGDAMPGGGSLRITTANVTLGDPSRREHAHIPEGDYATLSVRDTGHGMDRETLMRIFEPFFTTKPEGKGTGLGMSTVYGIVKQTGAHITVESAPEQGTLVTIYFRRVDADTEIREQHSATTQQDAGSETVLVVEDQHDVRAVICDMLGKAGYTVLDASSGAEAIRVADSFDGPIHLLVTDMVMPEMRGREVAACLLPQRPDMKVIFMSGYTEEMSAHQRFDDPGTTFIAKPFKPSQLLAVLREFLATSSS